MDGPSSRRRRGALAAGIRVRRRLHAGRGIADTGAPRPRHDLLEPGPALRRRRASPRDLAASRGGRPHHPRPHPRRGRRLDRRLRRARPGPRLPRRAQLDRRSACRVTAPRAAASSTPPPSWASPAPGPRSAAAADALVARTPRGDRPAGLRRPRRLHRRPGRRGRRLRRRRHRRLGPRARACRGADPAGRARRARRAGRASSPTASGGAAHERARRHTGCSAHCAAHPGCRAAVADRRRLAPRAAADPRLRPVHPRRHRRRGLARPSGGWARCGVPRRRRHRHLRLGGAVRHRRRPALPPHHDAPALLRRRAATRGRAFAIYEGGLGIWGAVALGAARRLDRLPQERRHLPRFVDAAAPGVAIAQAIGRFGNWFNNEIYGAPTDLPWGLRIYEWDTGTGRPSSTPPATPSSRATSTRRSSTRRCGACCSRPS